MAPGAGPSITFWKRHSRRTSSQRPPLEHAKTLVCAVLLDPCQISPQVSMLPAHDRCGTVGQIAYLGIEQRKHDLFLPSDVPFQSVFEFPEEAAHLVKTGLSEVLESLKQFMQPLMVVTVILPDGLRLHSI